MNKLRSDVWFTAEEVSSQMFVFISSPFPPTLRTENPDGEQTKPAAQGETEQDDLEAENPEINADEQEEKKSIKSQKSSKGLAKIEDDKKSTSNHEENSNDEASEEDEEEGEPKKWAAIRRKKNFPLHRIIPETSPCYFFLIYYIVLYSKLSKVSLFMIDRSNFSTSFKVFNRVTTNSNFL